MSNLSYTSQEWLISPTYILIYWLGFLFFLSLYFHLAFFIFNSQKSHLSLFVLDYFNYLKIKF